MTKNTNRLANATSPYLLQHADNPVDWYEWGEEALQKAIAENKPIFLSVGYSACHWCHVMAHESFENPEIAKVMNRHFINIKVDREERPDIDEIYMAAVQMLTGAGGWPMSVWLTPDLNPFYGGTYFPPDDRYGRPGFMKILTAISDAWVNQPQSLIKSANELSAGINDSFNIKSGENGLDDKILKSAFFASKRTFDPSNGGFGSSPKFPHAMELSLLLRYYKKYDSTEALGIVDTSLNKMARGGIYDQLGGGFHRYSTDDEWLVPHFEKMLYDQALLVRSYAEVFQITGKTFYRKIVEDTLDYVLEQMTSPQGGFYSAEDADSEGIEGKFYVWTKAEIERILEENARLFSEALDVSERGNWEDANILRIKRDWAFVAKEFGMDEDTFAGKIQDLKQVVLKQREKRISPGLDDKILTDWNGLMISAFVFGYKITGQEIYKNAATKAALFFKNKMYDSNHLYHSYRKGVRKIDGFLTDYSFLIASLLDLYSVTFDINWITWAIELTKQVENLFAAEGGGYYFTSGNQEYLIARSKSPIDNAMPSGNSVMVLNLVRLAELTGNEEYRQSAWETVKSFAANLKRYPQAYSEMLIGYDYLLGPSQQIVFAERDRQKAQQAAKRIYSKFLPGTVVILNDSSEEARIVFPNIADKTELNGKPQFYLCENFTCKLPVGTVDELSALMDKGQTK